MKIALIVKRLEVGGIENLVIRIANCLIPYHEVSIICTEGEGFWDIRLENTYVNFKKNCMWNFKDPIVFIESIADYINKESFEAIYFNDTLIGNALSTLVKSSVKKISVLHALDSTSISVAISNRAYIDGFIAVSPRVKGILDEYELNNVFLIPNGIGDEFFQTPNEISREEKQLNLLFCGRLSHHDKGVLYLPELLEMFAELSNLTFTLTVIGDGPDRKQLEEIFHARNLNKYVLMKGNVSRNCVISEMKTAHFLVFPSRSEGFGLSILEAQSMGCIPVAFKIEGVTDFIINDNFNGLLCEYENTKEMFEKISNTFIDKVKMIQLSKAAILNAHNFKIEKTANEWVNITDRMLSSKKKCKDTDVRSNILDVLSLAANQEAILYKRKWMENYYYNLNGNLTLLKNNRVKNVVIFGTMYMSYFIYADLLKNNFNIVSFIDNFRTQPGFINTIPINKDFWLVENENMYDAVIISVESSKRKDIKQNIKSKIPGKQIFDWTDFL